MTIPKNITYEHIIQALNEIDEIGFNEGRESVVYKLIFNGKLYPPKYVISTANKYANGSELDSSEFSGGDESNNYLINYNFAIIKIDAYQNALNQLRNISSNIKKDDGIKEIVSAREEVYSKYQPMFTLNKIPELSKTDFESFLQFENNKHWTGLYRQKGSLTEDMDKLRSALKILFDESKPIFERYDIIRPKNERNLVNGLAKALMTAILHIEYPEKYGVWNQTSEEGLKKIDLWPKFKKGATEGDKYSVLNEIFLALSKDLNLDLWSLDALWWGFSSMNQTILTKENVLEAISIAKLIVDGNLVGSQLSERNDDEIINKNKYNSIIKPKIEEFKLKNEGNTPNQLLKLYLEKVVNRKGFSDKFDVKGFHYKGQVVNPFVWSAITIKDDSIQNGKTSKYPQLYILINDFCILFGFCYGSYVKNSDKCVQFVKFDERLKQQLIELSNVNKEIHIFASFDQNDENNNHEIEFNESKDVDNNWTNDVHLINIIKQNEIPANIEIKVFDTFDKLFELFLKTSEIDTPIKDDYPLIKKLLSNKKQVVLYGPPGTGKTFLASNFIKSNTSDQIYSKKTSFDRNFFWFTVNPKRWDPENLWKEDETQLWPGNLKSAFQQIDVGDILFMYVSRPIQRVTGIAECIKKEPRGNDTPAVAIKGLKRIKGPKWQDLKNDDVLSESTPVKIGLRGTLFPLNENEASRILNLSNISLEDLKIEKVVETEILKNHEFITFHPSFSYEDFIEGLRPLNNDDGQISYEVDEGLFKKFSRSAFNALMAKAEIEKEWGPMESVPQLTREEKEKAKNAAEKVPFYLVIDEINRGDMSRIFGELITLLESDKRLTSANELITTLPYSKTKFAVPPNLYLIGTMNTADKSIALIDVALRRRFGFIEMMPDYDVLEKLLISDDEGIQEVFNLAILALKKVNENILKTYDRDHQIGHSYLLKLIDSVSRNDSIENFRFIWYYEILPLMQEYFYDAPAKLKQVIGEEFIKVENRSFSFIDNLEGEEFIKTIKRMINSEKRQDEIGD